MQSQIQVNYEIQYPLDPAKPPPAPVVVTVATGSPALDVMEKAVDLNKDYRFTATYYGTTLGFEIDTIYGIESKDPYYWFFYIQKPGCQPELAPTGVSNYNIPGADYSVIFRYQKDTTGSRKK